MNRSPVQEAKVPADVGRGNVSKRVRRGGRSARPRSKVGLVALLSLVVGSVGLPLMPSIGSGPSGETAFAAEPVTWTTCAQQFGGGCSYEPRFTGVRQMRYGSPVTDQWAYASFFGGLGSMSCSAAAFEITFDVAPGQAKICQYSSVIHTTTLPAPTNPMGSTIDRFRVPIGHPGASTSLIVSNGAPAAAAHDGVGAFRISCEFSHMRFDDPIVFPNQVGRSHLHTFFGNTNANATSTANSLMTTGSSTCAGGTANRSSYWVPSVIDTRSGTPIAPQHAVFYYKSGYRGVEPSEISPMPAGLRIIAGEARATNAADASVFAGWSCAGVGARSIPTCPTGSRLHLQLDFPQCWDGVHLDVPDHRSHMAYGVPGVGCPASHPVAIPVITFNIFYDVGPDDSTANWRIASDMYSDGPGGYSIHGDWFNGWDPVVEAAWINGCVRAARSCSDSLGDNRTLAFSSTSSSSTPPTPTVVDSIDRLGSSDSLIRAVRVDPPT